VAAPAVVAQLAVVKVMLPDWALSPTVTVPLAVVWIRAQGSASVRLIPGHGAIRSAQAHGPGGQRRAE